MGISSDEEVKIVLDSLLVEFDILYIAYSGSILHGTSGCGSDVDITAIYIPPIKDVLNGKVGNNINIRQPFINKEGEISIDIKIISIQEFLRKIKAMEANSLELYFSLFSPHARLYFNERSEILFECRHLISSDVSSFIGMSKSNKRNNGEDSKYTAHKIRALMEACELLNTGFIKFPLKYADYLKEIKSGDVPVKQCDKILCDLNSTILGILETPPPKQCGKKADVVTEKILRTVYGLTGG